MKAKPPTKPVKDVKVKPDPRAKSKIVGNGERIQERERVVLEKRRSGLGTKDIAKDLGLNHSTVCNILAKGRKELAKVNAEATKELRDIEAGHYISILQQWMPLALQPLTQETYIEESGRQKTRTVFNPCAAVALNLVLKAKVQYARLLGLNLEKPAENDKEEKLTRDQTLVLISQQVIYESPKPKGAVERFGMLDITDEPKGI
jgi:DNA-binding CsgD family transcriptional regulator